ncbi:MAG: hypothetical protein IBX55_20405 [Methyloprofundus sp.]|nr:hypothetical protein [Methyloprofundus sp.]
MSRQTCTSMMQLKKDFLSYQLDSLQATKANFSFMDESPLNKSSVIRYTSWLA